MDKTPETAPEPEFTKTEVGEVEDKAEVETDQTPVKTPAESDEVPAEGSDAEAEKTEDTFIGNYKTKEDAEKGLKEGQRKITDLGTKNANLSKQVQELQSFLATNGEKTNDGTRELTQEERDAQELVGSVVEQKIAPLKEQLVRSNQRNEVADLRERFSDFDEAVPELRRIFNENPDIQNQPNALARAYTLWKSDPERLEQLTQSQRTAGIKEGTEGVIQKQQAATEKPTKAPQIDESSELFQKGFGDNPNAEAQVAYFKKLYKDQIK